MLELTVYNRRTRLFRYLLLCYLLLAPVVLSLHSFLIHPAYGAVIPSSFQCDPSDYATDLTVSDPTQAYDADNFTRAEFSRDADGYFELTDFSQRSGKINWVDFKMRCEADASTDDKYRILYLVDPSPEETVLVNWTSSYLHETTHVWSFAAEPEAEPNDGVWSWTDISNVRFRVEIDSVGEPDGAYFWVYEAWLTVFVNYPIVSVDPPEIVDPALVPGAEFTIDIVVDYVEKLANYQFEMSFNPAVLEGVSVEDGPFLSSGGGEVTVFASTPQFNNTAGMLKLFGATLLDPTVNNPLGGGVLAIVTFGVVGDGVSNLTLSEFTLLMDATGETIIDGSEMPVCLRHGYFSNEAYDLTVGSTPITGVEFTLEFPNATIKSYETNKTLHLATGSYTVEMPTNWIIGETEYAFLRWENGSTSATRGIELTEDVTITATYIEAGIEYTLTVGSTPITGVEFTLDGESYVTNTTETLSAGGYTLKMPTHWTVDETMYEFDGWEDDPTAGSTRGIELTEDMVLTATYREARYTLEIESTPVAGVNFTLNDEPCQTPFSESLLAGSYIVNMSLRWEVSGIVFKFVAWEDDPTADSLRVVELMSDLSLSAIYLEVAEYSLEIDSVTIDGAPMPGVTFTLEFPNATVESYETPFNETLSADSYTVEMPDKWTVGETGYEFLAWTDLVETSERTFILGSDTSLTAIYMPGEEEYLLEIDAMNPVDFTPLHDMDFKLDGSDQTTPFSSVPLLKAGNHVVQMPAEWEDGGTRYWFVRWEDTASKNPARAVALTSNMSLTAVYANLTVHNVNKDTYYELIQDAIDDADSDDTIEVYPKTYYENLFIDTPLKLIGKDPYTTIVDGGGGWDPVMYVTADNVAISGFTLQNSSWIGIYIEGASPSDFVTGCIISNNIMSNLLEDIGLWNCEDNIIEHNILKTAELPMWLDTSHNNVVYGNTITSSPGLWDAALSLWSSNNNTIYGNTFSNNSVGGLAFWDSYDNEIYYNNFLHNALTMTVRNATSFQENNGWTSPSNAYFSDNAYANAAVDGANVTYYGYGFVPIEYYWGTVQARITKIEVGIEAFCPDGDDYIQVQVSWSNGADWTSLFSYTPPMSDSNEIVYIDVTDGRTWTWDELSDGSFLVRIFKRAVGDEDVTYADWLPVRVTSVLQAYDDGDNSWDYGYPSGGNYWSDYTGVDVKSGLNQDMAGSDAIGDTPYEIPDYSTDHYPLMDPSPLWLDVVWDDVTYAVRIISNSTITAFKFSQEDKQISFNVTGPDCTTGFCQVSIRKDLLDAPPDKWTVLVDGNNVTDEAEVASGTVWSQLYFTYEHSTQIVLIKGTIVVDNIPPIADAGPDQTVDEDTVVTFDGSASWDDIAIKDYKWTFEEGGTPKVLVGKTNSTTFENPGFYFVTLEVTDWGDDSDTDTLLITVRDTTPPTADAGPDQTVDEDTLVVFDGSNSTDNAGIVSYVWTFKDVTPWKTKEGRTVTYTFVTPPGPYTVELKVTDARGNPGTDTVSVTVRDTTKPVANASRTPTSVKEDTTIRLDGTASTDNVGIIEYTWYVEDVVPQTLYGENRTYEGWNTPGIYNVTLKVSDAAGNWNTTQLDITVLDITKPEADAGPTQIVYEDTLITFDGSASSDNDPFHDLNYNWTFVDGTLNITLTGVRPTYNFTSPGDYVVTLNVTDAAGNWDTDKTIIMVRDATVPWAVADVSPSDTVDEDTLVIFNGSGSTDNIGIESYTWAFTDGGVPQTLDGVIANYTFANPGVYVVTLKVVDGEGKSDTDTIVITVLDITAPVANAGSNQTVDEDTVVMFDGSASRDNGAIENYTWAFTENGKLRTLKGVSPNYIFVTPGVYVVNLTVTDAAGNWDTDKVVISVHDVTTPIAVAGVSSSDTVDKGTQVTFNGSASTDNVGIESYTWAFTDGGVPQTLDGVIANYTFEKPGVYPVTLTVTDAAGNWDTDTATISVLSDQTWPGSGSLPIWDIVFVVLAAAALGLAIFSFVRRGSKT